MSKADAPAPTVNWKEAVAGAISGALTTLLLHPLDVVRTRLQVQESGFSRYRGAVHAVQTITRREGAHGLYAGLPFFQSAAVHRAQMAHFNKWRTTAQGSHISTQRYLTCDR